jgi:hypothetical protein
MRILSNDIFHLIMFLHFHSLYPHFVQSGTLFLYTVYLALNLPFALLQY